VRSVASKIDDVLNGVLDREGWPSYGVHPNDRGGPTKGGITLRTLESWRHRRCTRAELQRLTKGEALAILRRRYVETNGIQRLTGDLQAQVVDDAVLSGPYLAAQDLQHALGTVAVDGIIGSRTLGAIESSDVDELGRRLAVTRATRLARHVQSNPDQLVFLTGWISRALLFV
jgi:lysozyme family protein